MNQLPEWLRPSMLPKLALCAHFRSAPAGAAAERGTLLDGVFRALIARENVSSEGLTPEDKTAVRWAEQTARALAGDFALESTEDKLRVEVLGMTGTADLLCEDGCWSADLKTGQIRNYREQQAAYALGFMDQFFRDEWTVYLLFCDQEEVVTLRYTRDEALEVVQAVIDKATSGLAPALNDYCGWCSNQFTCPARQKAVTVIEAPVIDLDKATSDQLRDFVIKAGIVEEFAEKAKDLLKERVAAGEKVAGVSLVSRKGTLKLPAVALAPAVTALGAEAVLSKLGDITESKAKEIWPEGMPFPVTSLVQLPGSSFVRVSTPKAIKDKAA